MHSSYQPEKSPPLSCSHRVTTVGAGYAALAIVTLVLVIVQP